MPRIKLTERVIPTLKGRGPQDGSRQPVFYFDASTPGFGVAVSTKTGVKTYVAQRDLPSGRTRRVTIGTVSELTLEKAREKAGDIIHGMRHGIDPKAARLGHGEATLKAHVELYIERHNLSEKSKKDYLAMVRHHLGDWLDLALATITGPMVEDRYHELVKKKGAATANLCLRIFRAVYNYANRDRTMPANPALMLQRQWQDVPRRTRIVGAKRLPAFYSAVVKLENPIQRDYILFCLFTGLRRVAAASLTWDCVDLTELVIRIPLKRTKHKRDEFKLPISDFVHDLLKRRSELGGEFVFPANSRSGYIAEPKYPLSLVAKATGIVISIHDLRRDFSSAANNAKISLLALKALVDHALGDDVTAGYVQITTEQLRESAQRVCDQLKTWCGI